MTHPPAIYLHVGLAKTGTTFLQDQLREHHKRLRSAGLHYPLAGEQDHFRAALDAVGRLTFLGGEVARTDGAWDALAAALVDTDLPRALMSHESLAGADLAGARRVLDRFDGHDVHVVVTVRDPARQLLADWQEHIKIRRTMTFGQYVRRSGIEQQLDLADDAEPRPFRNQQLLRVLRIWGGGLAPERVHVVTVPQPGADPMTLWRRFADAIDVADADSYSRVAGTRANARLGVASTELVRRINIALGDRLSGEAYARVVKGLLSEGVLPRLSNADAPALPDRLRPRADELATSWIEGIRAAGYTVHGDLDDLLPVHGGGRRPARPDPQVVLDDAAGAIAELLTIVHDLSQRGDRVADPELVERVAPRRVTAANAARVVRMAGARARSIRHRGHS